MRPKSQCIGSTWRLRHRVSRSHIHETFEPQFRADIVNGTLALWTRSHVMPNLGELSERDRAATDSVEEFKHGTVKKAEYFDPMGR
jgi:hypothetical protein